MCPRVPETQKVRNLNAMVFCVFQRPEFLKDPIELRDELRRATDNFGGSQVFFFFFFSQSSIVCFARPASSGHLKVRFFFRRVRFIETVPREDS